MFESIVVRHLQPTDIQQPLDVGFMVEAMLFYGRVEVANEAMMKELIGQCGPMEVVELLEREHFHLVYLANGAGIQTENTGTAQERYSPSI